MSLDNRVGKLEAMNGSRRPCRVCGASPSTEVRFIFGGSAERHAPVAPSSCAGCGLPLVFGINLGEATSSGGDDAA